MPEMRVNVEVWCATCGAGLCSQSTVRTGRHGDYGVDVEVCQHCLDAAKNEGYEAGIAQGNADGYKQGYNDGYETAMNRGNPE